jgi:hypothetical protein
MTVVVTLLTILVAQSLEVHRAAFECQWYDHSQTLKHFLLMIMARSQKAVYLSGCQFYAVSLHTFGKVQYVMFECTVSAKYFQQNSMKMH